MPELLQQCRQILSESPGSVLVLAYEVECFRFPTAQPVFLQGPLLLRRDALPTCRVVGSGSRRCSGLRTRRVSVTVSSPQHCPPALLQTGQREKYKAMGVGGPSDHLVLSSSIAEG